MKKTYTAVIAIAAALVVSLAATAAILQNQPSQAGSGQLAVMGTDPPIAASGVTAASVHYSSVAAHTEGSDMSTGWVQVAGSGSMNLMASGSAQTIASSKVKAGTYDAFRYNVDSAQVTYQGHEYTAAVASATVTAASNARVLVNQSSSAAAVVDMRTIIMNTATSTNPQFVFSATAEATEVPPGAVASASLQVGATANLSGIWWSSFVASSTTQVNLVATLSSSSMVLSLQNSGNANAQIQEVIVSPISSSTYASASLPASLTGSAVFTVNSSGSLQSATSLSSSDLLTTGATVASGSATTLTYNGALSLNFGAGLIQVSGVLAGQQYIVTAIGANTYASAIVVAS
jgi:Domain of unknown function (DUF4382)